MFTVVRILSWASNIFWRVYISYLPCYIDSQLNTGPDCQASLHLKAHEILNKSFVGNMHRKEFVLKN